MIMIVGGSGGGIVEFTQLVPTAVVKSAFWMPVVGTTTRVVPQSVDPNLAVFSARVVGFVFQPPPPPPPPPPPIDTTRFGFGFGRGTSTDSGVPDLTLYIQKVKNTLNNPNIQGTKFGANGPFSPETLSTALVFVLYGG